jgi:hypothetical protein
MRIRERCWACPAWLLKITSVATIAGPRRATNASGASQGKRAISGQGQSACAAALLRWILVVISR